MTVSIATQQPLFINYEQEEYERLKFVPWFSYTINLPERPLPSISERPIIRTQRLVIRSLITSDLEPFHELRSAAVTQQHSTARGRPSRELDESRQYLNLYEQEPQRHWWFGAFLASNGELIGEGGLPDCLDMPVSGRPEAEILIKPEYWRQGYAAELLRAVTQSWWDLPRKKRRQQLCPAFVSPEKEPGDELKDGMVFRWEATNNAARDFFQQVFDEATLSSMGCFVDFDQRDGRNGELVRWEGVLLENSRE